MTIAIFCLALASTLVLAAFLTPRAWWRRMNARAAAVLGLGTWGIFSLIMWLAGSGAAGPALASNAATNAATHGVSTPRIAAAQLPRDGVHKYRVFEDLNLRSARGTQAQRVAVVRAGSTVTTTGRRDGDWWQVSARIDGREVSGWSSSLWLRRADEMR